MHLIGAHEPEVADFDKAFRQHMLQIAPEKLRNLKTASFLLFRFIILISKRNRCIVMERQIPLIRHRRAEDVRREILNHLPPVTRRFAMHHPVYIPAPDIFRHLQIEFRMSFLQRLSEQILEPQSRRVDLHQKLLVSDLDPVFVIFR